VKSKSVIGRSMNTYNDPDRGEMMTLAQGAD
jgi:hypothetical protein